MGGLIHVGGWHGIEYIGTERRLLVFEPQREAFARLKLNLGALPNVELVNVALGAEEGVGVMHTAHPSHSSSLLTPRQAPADGVTFEGTEAVSITTLDRAMQGREGYDELRIDTQGYELEVLRGARRTLER
ncbi:MAG: FkbM family methyltransferase, partial [Deltaproteobacteria bacterium]|nr:FkbM family methyltransferase [Deltaproteobacteria bacterium]